MKSDLVVMGGIALGVAALGWYIGRSISAGIASGALDPTSDKNAAYTGANKVGAAVTGDEHFALGSWIYEKLHPNESARLALGPVSMIPRKGETYQ